MAEPTEDDKKKVIKGLIKESLKEFLDENKETGRTETGKVEAKKSGSIFDIFGG